MAEVDNRLLWRDRVTETGGGFWALQVELGWMHDTLDYMKRTRCTASIYIDTADLWYVVLQPYRKLCSRRCRTMSGFWRNHYSRSVLGGRAWQNLPTCAPTGWMWAFPGRNCCLWGMRFAGDAVELTPASTGTILEEGR